MRKLLVVAVLALGMAQVARAGDVLFYWIDKSNTVHATQNLDEVPEPYKAMYRARLKELEEAKKRQGNQVPVPSSPSPSPSANIAPGGRPSIVDQELARQKQWRDEVQRWRTELRLATEDVQRIQNDIDNAQINPILRMTPQGRAEVEPLEQEKEKALTRVAIARKTLAEDLPARARRENVPPRWLD